MNTLAILALLGITAWGDVARTPEYKPTQDPHPKLAHNVDGYLQPAPRQLAAVCTAYSLIGRTRTGTYTHSGTVAVDPSVIPLGSRLELDALPGTYVAEDTGGGVRGAQVDVWMPNYSQAVAFGRRACLVTVRGVP